jgi:dipeptidyl aminopeptidase/acylaminoacyl peptidase
MPLLLGLSSGLARAAMPSCVDLPAPSATRTSARPVTADDLVRIRDFGPATTAPTSDPIVGLSPDRRELAVELRRADPERNDSCTSLYVVALDERSPPRLVDSGGGLIRQSIDSRTLADFPSGVPTALAPAWSPAGDWIATLKQIGPRARVWLVRPDGSGSVQLDTGSGEVRRFAWNAKGTAIVFAVREPLAQAEARIDAEGRSGWVYDDRFWPEASDRPFPRGPLPVTIRAIDIGTGQVRAATPAEVELLQPSNESDVPADAQIVARSGSAIAWTAPSRSDRLVPPTALHRAQNGRRLPCPAPVCGDGIVGLWWMENGRSLVILREQGVAPGDRLAFYRWANGETHPRLLLDTTDLLIGCQPVDDRQLLCGREASLQPRRLILLDTRTGRTRTVFDANPEFSRLRLGAATRLRWQDDAGRGAFSDLVLPPDHKPGQRHPLIIVQYASRGFLRGGTGDEYPIQLFASHGFAVLSFNRPADIALASDARDIGAFERVNFKDWADRRHVQAMLETGIERAKAMGVIDPHRIGITGLSEGATTALWALLHSSIFSAAALSSCCDDEGAFAHVGPVWRDQIIAYGYPRPDKDHQGFWGDYSLAANAARVRTPILMQLASSEFRGSLASYDALQRFHAPADLLVFPDEYHVKWQPAHRWAIYERSVCWFGFWLQQPAPDVCRPEDLERWSHLVRPSTSPSSAPHQDRSPLRAP